MAIIPSLLFPFPLETDGEKGCRRTTVERVRHFYIYILSCTYCDSFFAAVPSRTRTRTYAPFPLHEPCVPGNGEIHGIEVTHGCGNNGGRGAAVGGGRGKKKKKRGGRRGKRDGCANGRGTRAGDRNEMGRGAKHVCAWREVDAVAQRGSIFPIANFALRFPLSLSHAHPLITDSPYLPSAQATCTAPPRFPRRTIHSFPAPVLFQPPPSLLHPPPPLSPPFFLLCTTFSLNLPRSSLLYNIARGRRPNRWCRCRHNKKRGKSDGQRTRGRT